MNYCVLISVRTIIKNTSNLGSGIIVIIMGYIIVQYWIGSIIIPKIRKIMCLKNAGLTYPFCYISHIPS